MADQENKTGAQTGAPSKQGKESKPKYIVAEPFSDRDSFSKMWNKGDDVSHFDEARLADCVNRGLVKKV